jgi:ABC-type transporter Mla subunit MlaD
MKALRRILGILVMLAGILGLALSLTGLISVWVVKPTVANSTNSTIATLISTIQTSQKAMEVTGQALGATVDSVNTLSSMLSTTADSVKDTQPVVDQLNQVLGETVPSTLESATNSLKTAQQAAAVLDGAIKSLDTFRALLSATPLLGSFIEQPAQPYNPDKPLAESLGELATNLEGLPQTFTEMSTNLGKADDNLVTIQDNLTTMSNSVALISKNLGEYQSMISQSKSSMDNLLTMLTNVQNNLPKILNGVATVLSLFFVWLLATQVVILSQGWELYQGTASRMAGGPA